MNSKLILLTGVAALLIGCEGGDRKVSDFGTTNSPGTETVLLLQAPISLLTH